MSEIKLTIPVEEQETTINIMGADTVASIWTNQRRMINKLEKLRAEHEEIKLIRVDDWEGYEYEVPVKWIKISPPRKVNMTDEQKAAAAERLKRVRLQSASEE